MCFQNPVTRVVASVAKTEFDRSKALTRSSVDTSQFCKELATDLAFAQRRKCPITETALAQSSKRQVTKVPLHVPQYSPVGLVIKLSIISFVVSDQSPASKLTSGCSCHSGSFVNALRGASAFQYHNRRRKASSISDKGALV